MVISRRAIAADLDALAEAWQWTAEDTLVHGLPLFHVHGLVLGLLGSLRVGNRFVHTGKPTPQAYAAGGTLYFGGPHGVVPGGRRHHVGRGAGLGAAAGVRQRGAAGAGVHLADPVDRARPGGALRRHRIADHPVDRAGGERRPGWVGLPLRGVRTRLRHDDGSSAPHDGETIGSLQVTAPTMFDGYPNRPDATAQAYEPDGWYRTGDAAVIDADGMHRIVGRESWT